MPSDGARIGPMGLLSDSHRLGGPPTNAWLAELRRRKVFRVGAAYALVAWLLIQVIVSVEAPLQMPDWADTLIITLLIIGFPIALILALAFYVTPEKIKLTWPVMAVHDPSAPPTISSAERGVPASDAGIAVRDPRR